MDRRHALKILGAAPGLALFSGLGAGAQEDGHDHHLPAHLERCAKACTDCARECSACFDHCAGLAAGGNAGHAQTMRICLDCSDLCAASALAVSRRGPLMAAFCKACAEACDACEAACAKFEADPRMAACARSCRDCARSCREMLEKISK